MVGSKFWSIVWCDLNGWLRANVVGVCCWKCRVSRAGQRRLMQREKKSAPIGGALAECIRFDLSWRARQALGRQRGARYRHVRCDAIRPNGGDFAQRPSTPVVTRMRSGARSGEWQRTELGALEGRRVLVAVERLFCFKTPRQNAPVFNVVSRDAGARARAARTLPSRSVPCNTPHPRRLRTAAIDAHRDPHAKRRALGRMATHPTWGSRAAPVGRAATRFRKCIFIFFVSPRARGLVRRRGAATFHGDRTRVSAAAAASAACARRSARA